MWQLIVGYVAGGASALIFVHVMNKKLREQRAQYERQLEGSNRRISDLTCKDAYRQGRDYESDAQRRYLFLTKNPKRYVDLYGNGILRVRDSFWYGSTITGANEPFFFSRMPDDNPHTFCSIEPIIEPVGTMQEMPDWVIVGAETGNRKGKVAPCKEWIDEIAAECKRRGKPLFMKDSLHDLMGDDFKQEFPWEVK